MKIIFCLFSFTLLLACSPKPTKDRAKDMFREPSSDEKGKIPDKFQPIDHEIETNGQ